MPSQTPSIGRIVHYRLSEEAAQQINRRRTQGASIADRMKREPPAWPMGAQAHIGNEAEAGQTFPMLLVKVAGTMVNGQVFLDGNDVYWATNVNEGIGVGEYSWPPRV